MADQITELQRQLADTRLERDRLAGELAQVRTENTALRPQVSNLQHTVARLERENAELRAAAAEKAQA